MAYSTALMNHFQGHTQMFEDPYTSFYFGNCIGLTESIIINQVPQFSSRIVFRILTLLLRFCIIPLGMKGLYLVQMAFVFVSIYLDYNKEMHDKKLFGSYYYSREQLSKFKELVTSDIPDGIVILSRDLRKCLFANNAFKSLLAEENFTRGFPSCLKQFQIHQQPNSQRNETALESATFLSSLEDFLFEESTTMTNQKLSLNLIQPATQAVFETKAFQLLWDEEPAVVIMFHDITQQNTILELRLAANIQKDRILATVSHELRTPLNSILGMINLIQNSIHKDPSTLHYLKVCENSCNLLQSLVNSILDLNLIRFNQIKLDPQKIDLHQFLKDLIQLFQFQCAEKGIYLTQNIAPSVSKYLITDKARLSQILINLLGNALKFTMKGGIAIFAEEHVVDNEVYLELEVQDTGIGIKPEDHEKLFKMFGKLEHKDTIVNPHGIGLGLNISDSLSKLLCCNEKLAGIKVKSAYKEGSRFSFLLNTCLDKKLLMNPRGFSKIDTLNFGSFDEMSLVHTKMKNYIPSPKKLKNVKAFDFVNTKSPVTHPLVSKRVPFILIVDDNPLNLFVAEKLISCQGYKVKTALSGEIAIELFLNNNHSSEPILLILMDLQMPLMDGYMATKVLRDLMQEKKVPEVPIVALTANDTIKDKEMCVQVGMFDMLSKPLRIQDLFRVIQSISK